MDNHDGDGGEGEDAFYHCMMALLSSSFFCDVLLRSAAITDVFASTASIEIDAPP